MKRLVIFVVVAACSKSEPSTTTSTTTPPVPADTAKRPPPPAPLGDTRPVTFADFMNQPLNPRDGKGNEIHASEDGGCHIYVRSGDPGPPGSYPPPTRVACPPSMLAAEWGRCIGAGTMYANAARTECVCQGNEGDPPPPPVRVACPPK